MLQGECSQETAESSTQTDEKKAMASGQPNEGGSDLDLFFEWCFF